MTRRAEPLTSSVGKAPWHGTVVMTGIPPTPAAPMPPVPPSGPLPPLPPVDTLPPVLLPLLPLLPPVAVPPLVLPPVETVPAVPPFERPPSPGSGISCEQALADSASGTMNERSLSTGDKERTIG